MPSINTWLRKDDDIDVYPDGAPNTAHAPARKHPKHPLAEQIQRLQHKECEHPIIPPSPHHINCALVEYRARRERPDDEPDVAESDEREDEVAGVAAEVEERLSEELVPALRPELVQ